MGQYWIVGNLDKQQFLDPHDFGDGLKLLEFGASGVGTLTGLTILLAEPGVSGRGGGDLVSDNPIVGSWSGDRIVIAGDYGDPLPEHPEEGKYWAGDLPLEFMPTEKDQNLYGLMRTDWENISLKVKEAMADDHYLREDMRQSYRERLD